MAFPLTISPDMEPRVEARRPQRREGESDVLSSTVLRQEKVQAVSSIDNVELWGMESGGEQDCGLMVYWIDFSVSFLVEAVQVQNQVIFFHQLSQRSSPLLP